MKIKFIFLSKLSVLRLVRIRYSVIVSLAISLAIGFFGYIESGNTFVGWFVGVFGSVFLLPLYYRSSRNIRVGRFKYKLKGNKAALYSSAINYDDEVIFYGKRLFGKKINASIGGNLFLLEDRIIFQTNLLNYPYRREVVIFVKDVICISIDSDCPWAKSFAVETDRHKYQFLSKQREEWKTHILRRKAALQ